jgi:hypothetical protein
VQDNGTDEKLFVKSRFLDFAPFLELNGEKIEIVEKFKWYQYAIGGLPILLLTVGGAIGGVIGTCLTAYNFSVFRGANTDTMKNTQAIGVTVLGFGTYWFLTMMISSALGQ